MEWWVPYEWPLREHLRVQARVGVDTPVDRADVAPDWAAVAATASAVGPAAQGNLWARYAEAVLVGVRGSSAEPKSMQAVRAHLRLVAVK